MRPTTPAALAALLLAALAPPARADPPADANLPPPQAVCVIRQVDPDTLAMEGDHSLTAWVTVHRPVHVSVYAQGFATSTKLGRFSLSVLRDGGLLAGSGESRGVGKLIARVDAEADLQPGRQYRFVARPNLSQAQLHGLRLKIGETSACT